MKRKYCVFIHTKSTFILVDKKTDLQRGENQVHELLYVYLQDCLLQFVFQLIM